jgi:phospho-N-acetylmuramoyl-pentapeptide-transferase
MVFFTAAAAAQGKYDLALLPATLVGALIGYLFYNWHPAKVFMGDTGSLFLGGVVCALAFALEMPLILILVGIIYICETLSVILQVGYFKLTHGKRLFKMSPIHHHFEMCGWKEEKICFIFTGVTVVMCVLAWFGISGLAA